MKHIKDILVIVVELVIFAVIIYYVSDLLEIFTTPDVNFIFSFFFTVTMFLIASIY